MHSLLPPMEGPNVKTNPLASHGGASVNAVKEDGPSRTKRLGDVATSRRFIYQSASTENGITLCEILDQRLPQATMSVLMEIVSVAIVAFACLNANPCSRKLNWN